MSQESDVCCTTSMYDIQNRCIPDEIDLFYFKTCIITHNNNVIEQNINVSMFDILSVKEPHRFPSSATCTESETMSDTEEAPPPPAPRTVSAGPHAPPPPQIYNFPANFPVPAAMVCRGDILSNWK